MYTTFFHIPYSREFSVSEAIDKCLETSPDHLINVINHPENFSNLGKDCFSKLFSLYNEQENSYLPHDMMDFCGKYAKEIEECRSLLIKALSDSRNSFLQDKAYENLAPVRKQFKEIHRAILHRSKTYLPVCRKFIESLSLEEFKYEQIADFCIRCLGSPSELVRSKSTQKLMLALQIREIGDVLVGKICNSVLPSSEELSDSDLSFNKGAIKILSRAIRIKDDENYPFETKEVIEAIIKAGGYQALSQVAPDRVMDFCLQD